MSRPYLFLIVLAGILPACVPMKKYSDMEAQYNACKDERQKEGDKLKAEKTELSSQNEVYKKEQALLEADTLKLGALARKEAQQRRKMEKLHSALEKKYTALAAENDQQSGKILTELQNSRSQLQKRQDRLDSLDRKLQAERRSLETLKSDLEGKRREITSKDASLADLRRVLAQKDSAANALRQRITNALKGFVNQGLSIEQRNGKIYLLLDEQLLFAVGKSDVAPKGQDALKKIAAVLEKNPDISIMVEGHTDNTGGSRINWELSTKRALSISYIMLDNSKIDPKRVTASGRGQYMPVDPSDTPKARERNRRSEIVLTPNLQELYEMIDK